MQYSTCGLTRAENSISQLASYISFDAAQDIVGPLGCNHVLPTHVDFFFFNAFFPHQYPQVLLSVHLLLSLWGCSNLHAELYTWPCWAACWSLGPISWAYQGPSGLQPLLPVCWPHHLAVSSASMLRVHWISLSLSLAKYLNNTRCQIFIHTIWKLVLRGLPLADKGSFSDLNMLTWKTGEELRFFLKIYNLNKQNP